MKELITNNCVPWKEINNKLSHCSFHVRKSVTHFSLTSYNFVLLEKSFEGNMVENLIKCQSPIKEKITRKFVFCLLHFSFSPVIIRCRKSSYGKLQHMTYQLKIQIFEQDYKSFWSNVLDKKNAISTKQNCSNEKNMMLNTLRWYEEKKRKNLL